MQIHSAYINEHQNITLTSSIRRSIKGHEASLIGLSVIEHDPSSALAQDYYDVSSQIINIINEL